MQHDERFKLLLQEFLREFVELFLPDLLSELDFARVEWMQQELITDPPEGEKRVIDMLARVPVLRGEGERYIHLHIEVESAETVEPLRRRMYLYYHHLTHILNLEVIPVAVYLSVGLDGRGRDRYEVETLGRKPLVFEYDYVGLPGLTGADYLARPNVLGIALSALMRWPNEDRVEAALEALAGLVHSNEQPRRKMLLCDVVNTYAPLDDSQRVVLRSLLKDPARREVEMIVKTWYEEGEEKGMEKGALMGQRKLILRLLETRFGPLNESVKQRIDNWPAERLTDLGCDLLRAQSLRELGLED